MTVLRYKTFLDVFKKSDEEQNNGEQNIAETIESLEVKPEEESKNEEVKVQPFTMPFDYNFFTIVT